MSATIAASPKSALDMGLELLEAMDFSSDVIEQLHAAAALRSGDSFSLEAESPLLPAVEIVKAFPATVLRQAALGIPFEVTSRTLRDLERRMREYHHRNGKWGFDRFAWMQKHISSSLFEIGRLQFMPGRWRDDFEAYISEESREVWALADPGLPCNKEGQLDDDEGNIAFHTVRETTDAGVMGHAADPLSGTIPSAPSRLSATTRLAATKGDAVLHVHIPSGPGFSPRACQDSLSEARLFFARHFPEMTFKAICCRTWLLDPALRQIMPAQSNLLSLGHLFRLLPVQNANDRQHIERIFGSESDWRTHPPQTSLQRATQEFLAKNGKFRLTSGYLLWDDPRLEDFRRNRTGEA